MFEVVADPKVGYMGQITTTIHPNLEMDRKITCYNQVLWQCSSLLFMIRSAHIPKIMQYIKTFLRKKHIDLNKFVNSS